MLLTDRTKVELMFRIMGLHQVVRNLMGQGEIPRDQGGTKVP
jgi:hypothetical protein